MTKMFIPGILGLLGVARHGDPFCLSEEDVLEEVRVCVGAMSGEVPSAAGAPVPRSRRYFRVLALGDRQLISTGAGGA